MKISEVIKALENCKEEYGDLNVDLSFAFKENVVHTEQLFFRYDQYETEDVLSISSFPY